MHREKGSEVSFCERGLKMRRGKKKSKKERNIVAESEIKFKF